MRRAITVLALVVLLPLLQSGATPARPPPHLSGADGLQVSLAATYYVDASAGSDANSGAAPDDAWQTIQKAADTARAGETVAIRGGTYREGVHFSRHSGSDGAPVIFRAYPGETVIVTSPEWYGLYVRVNWIVIDGLHVQGSTSHGLFISGAHHNVVQNCEFSGHGWAGVMVGGDRGSTSHNVVQYCAIHDNAHEGVYLRSGYRGQPDIPVTGNVIQYNTIYRNGDEGIQNTATFVPPAPNGTVIRGNRVFGNGAWAAGACLEGDDLLVEDNVIHDNHGEVGGIWYSGGSGGVLRNNVIYGNRGGHTHHAAGMHLRNVAHARVDHNTIHGNAGYGILIRDAGPNVAIRNNILSSNDNQIGFVGGAPLVERNLIDGDSSGLGIDPIRTAPTFVRPEQGDFRLAAGCVAIDAGASVGVTRDIDGVPRPQGTGDDLGAYERPSE